MSWISLFENHVVLANILIKPLYCKCEQVEMRAYYWEHIKNHAHDSPIPYMSI
jgi:hypothetical protein